MGRSDTRASRLSVSSRSPSSPAKIRARHRETAAPACRPRATGRGAGLEVEGQLRSVAIRSARRPGQIDLQCDVVQPPVRPGQPVGRAAPSGCPGQPRCGPARRCSARADQLPGLEIGGEFGVIEQVRQAAPARHPMNHQLADPGIDALGHLQVLSTADVGIIGAQPDLGLTGHRGRRTPPRLRTRCRARGRQTAKPAIDRHASAHRSGCRSRKAPSHDSADPHPQIRIDGRSCPGRIGRSSMGARAPVSPAAAATPVPPDPACRHSTPERDRTGPRRLRQFGRQRAAADPDAAASRRPAPGVPGAPGPSSASGNCAGRRPLRDSGDCRGGVLRADPSQRRHIADSAAASAKSAGRCRAAAGRVAQRALHRCPQAARLRLMRTGAPALHEGGQRRTGERGAERLLEQRPVSLQ
jgi:hypothetical protein